MNTGLKTGLRGPLLARVAGAALVLGAVPAGLVAAADDGTQVQSLLEKLEERDATIRDLVSRVQQLEQRLDAVTAAPGGAAPAPTAAPVGAGAAASALRAQAETSADPAAPQQPSSTPPADGAPAADSAGPATESEAPAAPGAFAVDPGAAERALERTLVSAGALLLPFGAVDVEPSFTYIRQQTTQPLLLQFEDEDEITFQLTEIDTRENELTGSLDLRFGLPWTSQFELGIPVVYKDQSEVFLNTEESNNAFGFGDVSVGLAKELVRERGWRPDLLARVTWDAETGQEEAEIQLGNGFHSITASLTALKRQDPLAFVASGFYRTSFEKDNVQPGDEFGFFIGTVLAASPDTSLSLSLQQTFSKELKLSGSSLSGSDQVSSSLIVGASSVLGAGVLLSVNAGVGLTDDAPDYFVGISLPIRFNLPVR